MKKFWVKNRFFFVFGLSAVLILALFLSAISNINAEKIMNASVSCYAIEGSYPPSIEYLVENYGIQIDTKRFTVKYELYASNLMPEITVLINKK